MTKKEFEDAVSVVLGELHTELQETLDNMEDQDIEPDDTEDLYLCGYADGIREAINWVHETFKVNEWM